MAYAYTDLDLNFVKQKDGDIKTLTDVEAVKANILNIVNTMRGSRRMRPNFAYGPHDFLFEPVSENTAKNLGEAILYSIEEYEDRADIENINVLVNFTSGAYNVTIRFKLKELGPTSDIYSFNFILKRL